MPHPKSIFVLGPSGGWHADQLQAAAIRRGHQLQYGEYEHLRATFRNQEWQAYCGTVPLNPFDLILARTMPLGTLESITFRLAILHSMELRGVPVVNPTRTLEIAIDKFATLAMASLLGWSVPETIVCQNRGEAMQAYDALGGDVVVKPLLGSEGRGLLRVTERQLAWTTMTTLERLETVLYVQKFVGTGGRDLRILIWGEELFAVRREHPSDWRTNVSCGASCRAAEVPRDLELPARRLATSMKLRYAAIDLIEDLHGCPHLLEVNAIPGWKGAEEALQVNLAQRLIDDLASTKPIDAVNSKFPV
jgi:RimK family alpha-L-glutamate ligase